MWRLIPLYLFLLISVPTWAQVEESFRINDDLEIPVMRYEAFAEEAPILLWLPSSRGTSSKQAITATALGDLDVETWIVDLHMAYFVDAGRSSVQHFQPQDIADLISIAATRTTQKVYLIATDSVAKPALEGIALFQQQSAQAGKSLAVGGAILFHPALTRPSREAGIRASYTPIAEKSTIPIYYIQPSISTKQSRTREIQETLQVGGSPVFLHRMPGINAGFHMRPDEDLNDPDLLQRERLPEDLKRAIELLATQVAATPPPAFADNSVAADSAQRYGLKPLAKRTALPLRLNSLHVSSDPVDYSRNKLSLLSFWASWCEPCIKELPSLKRLHDDFYNRGLRIIMINVGETEGEIQSAINEFSMSDYTHLLDPEGELMNAWNVYAFPTNFLITASGTLSHGSIGGVEWDEPEVRAVINGLLN